MLMGNEAIARGAIEGGITLAASYPGTPSSEIGNTLARVAKKLGFHFEWSANEKVALEVAYGASMVRRNLAKHQKQIDEVPLMLLISNKDYLQLEVLLPGLLN